MILTEVDVGTTQLTAYQRLAIAEMQSAFTAEPGLVVTYLGQAADQPQKLVHFEVYQNQAAYEQYCQSQRFKEFRLASQALTSQQKAVEVKPDGLVNQGQLQFIHEHN